MIICGSSPALTGGLPSTVIGYDSPFPLSGDERANAAAFTPGMARNSFTVRSNIVAIFSGVSYLPAGKPELRGQEMIAVEAGIDALEREQRTREQTRGREERQRERELDDDERVACRGADGAAVAAAECLREIASRRL